MSELMENIDQLPEALRQELDCCSVYGSRQSRTSKRYPAVIATMLECNGTPTNDELLIGVYQKTREVLTRSKLTQTLWVMKKKGWLSGDRNSLVLNESHPDVSKIMKSLSLSRRDKAISNEPENDIKRKTSPSSSPRVKGGTPPNSSLKDAGSKDRTSTGNTTIVCSNCTTAKTISQGEERITWNGLDVCSHRCKRELRDGFEEI